MKERVILHSDVNNFFASVECSTRDDLKGLPVAVTGNPEKRNGIILAKNEIAKSYGVKTGQVIGEAKAICPSLVCLPPHYQLYEEISQRLHNLYLDYTNFVEPLGLDECWLDVTGSLKYLQKTGKQIADEIRERVKSEFGFTVSVGMSFSKIFAKLGSDMRKPDYTTCIPKNKFKQMVYPLPLNSIVGIGRRLEKKFHAIGIDTIGDFVKLEDSYLESIMGINGIRLKQDLLGLRQEAVADYYTLPPPKSIGNGTTTLKDIIERKDVQKVIYFLAEKVSYRMIKHKVYASTFSITLKTKDLKTYHISRKFRPTNSIDEIAKNCLLLADKIWKYNYPLRAVRIKGSNLVSSSVKQLSIFDEVKPDVSTAVKLINDKYGKIEFASNMANFINKSSHPQE